MTERSRPIGPRRQAGAWQRRRAWLGAGLGLVLSVTIVGTFFARSWWPPDDGAYGYVAWRVLAGDGLNGGIQDIHAGYVNLLHAGVLWIFGEDLRHLRYPLVALIPLAALIGYRILLPRGLVVALAGLLAVSSLSFVLFPNPTANWYAFVLLVGTIGALSRPGDLLSRLFLIGALIGLGVLTRQLSGALLAIGVLTWLLLSGRPASTGATPRLARAIIVVMALVIAAYLWRRQSIVALMLFGVWPLLLLAVAWRRTRLDDRAVASILARLAAGAMLPLVPLLLYHLAQGTLRLWFDDVVLAATRLSEMPFIGEATYAWIGLLAARNVVAAGDAAAMLNGIFWIALLAAPFLLGLFAVRAAARGPDTASLHPLPVVATVFSLAAIHYQVPIYLTYTTATTLLGLLWLSGKRTARATSGAVVFLSAVALVYQAGQPPQRTLVEVAAGTLRPMTAVDGLPRARIAMEAADRDEYRAILHFIATHSAATDTILAVPTNAELYFLSERRAPVRFFNATFGMPNEAAVEPAYRAMMAVPPQIVIHRRDDKYNSPATLALLRRLAADYRPAATIGGFDIYLPAAAGSKD